MSEPISVAVLLYHHVGPVREPECKGLTVLPNAFARQIATISAMGWTAITPNDWLRYSRGEAEIPERSVIITFDDAYADLVEHALPVLQSRSYPATVFVATGLVGKSINCNPATPEARLPIMTADEIARWCARGVVFGAHSRSHADLTTSPDIRDEIVGSKRDLEEITQSSVECFAYPYGKLDSNVESLVKQCFPVAFTIEEGMNDRATPLHSMRRTMVQHSDTVVDVLLRVRYGRSVLQRIRTAVSS